MKTILVPIDYSDSANNAAEYAIELSKTIKGKIILLHIYHIPLPTGEVPMFLISPEELEKNNLLKIKTFNKKLIKKTAGKAQIEHMVRSGFPSEEIIDISREIKPDIIVMGITGSGKLGYNLIGSTTLDVIKKSKVPVLIIPKKASFKQIKKIALAYNYSDSLKNEARENIKNIIHLLNAKLLVVNVVGSSKTLGLKNSTKKIKTDKALTGLKHTAYFIEGDSIDKEINFFIDTSKADWLIMMPHKYTFLKKLFHKSNTKQMAFHTHIPLLAIHE